MRSLVIHKLTKRQVAIALAILPAIVMAASGVAYFRIVQTAPKAVVKSTAEQVAKEKQLAQANKADQYFIGTGHYIGENSSKSKINKTEVGDLYKLTKSGEPKSFIAAYADSKKPQMANGWEAVKVGRDAMWIPGACAQKPSWMVGDHHIVIDDGEYDGAKATHYYAIYNTVDKSFIHFGGSLINDTQAKEKILSIQVENGKLVFYIDQQDTTGPYKTSTSFKHSKSNHDAYLIRRVVEIPDLAYSDYRVPYDQPSFDDYHVAVSTGESDLWLLVGAEGGKEGGLSGVISPNQAVALSSKDPSLAPARVASLKPYGDALSKYYHEINPNGSATMDEIVAQFGVYATGGSSYYLSNGSTPALLNTSSKIVSNVIVVNNNEPPPFILGAE